MIVPRYPTVCAHSGVRECRPVGLLEGSDDERRHLRSGCRLVRAVQQWCGEASTGHSGLVDAFHYRPILPAHHAGAADGFPGALKSVAIPALFGSWPKEWVSLFDAMRSKWSGASSSRNPDDRWPCSLFLSLFEMLQDLSETTIELLVCMLQDLSEAPIEFLVCGPVLYVYFDVEAMNVVLQVDNVAPQVGYVLSDASLHVVERISGHLSNILSVHIVRVYPAFRPFSRTNKHGFRGGL